MRPVRCVFFSRDDLRSHIFKEHLYPGSALQSAARRAGEDAIETQIQAEVLRLVRETDLAAEGDHAPGPRAPESTVRWWVLKHDKRKRCVVANADSFGSPPQVPAGWTRKFDCKTYETAVGEMRRLCGPQNNC